MMNCMSPSGERRRFAEASVSQHESSFWVESAVRGGVRFRIARVSLSRRIELARHIREIARRLEFLEASSDVGERLEAAVVQGEVDRAYLQWGLEAVDGLRIDGAEATPEMLIERGPLELAMEILSRIRGECGLSENERKN